MYYWCLSDDNNLHVQSNCPTDFQTTNRHLFVVVTSADNTDVPTGQCAIKFFHDNTFFESDGGKVKSGSGSSLSSENYHFVVNNVGNGIVNIFSGRYNKYLKLDGHEAAATEDSDCGDDCHFTVEERPFDPPETSGKIIM